jgi:hypothetical protein
MAKNEQPTGKTLMKKATAKLLSVNTAADNNLTITYSDGRCISVNLTSVIADIACFAPLADANEFNSAEISDFGWTLEWPCGASLDSDRLLEMALEQSGQLDTLRFRRWQDRHGLSLTGAAGAIGLSRRTISQYRTGARPIPKTVLLACKGWEVEQGL